MRGRERRDDAADRPRRRRLRIAGDADLDRDTGSRRGRGKRALAVRGGQLGPLARGRRRHDDDPWDGAGGLVRRRLDRSGHERRPSPARRRATYSPPPWRPSGPVIDQGPRSSVPPSPASTSAGSRGGGSRVGGWGVTLTIGPRRRRPGRGGPGSGAPARPRTAPRRRARGSAAGTGSRRARGSRRRSPSRTRATRRAASAVASRRRAAATPGSSRSAPPTMTMSSRRGDIAADHRPGPAGHGPARPALDELRHPIPCWAVLERPSVTERARTWLAQWGPMLPLLIAEATIWVGFGALLPILPIYFTEHGLSLPMLGVVVAAWSVATARRRAAVRPDRGHRPASGDDGHRPVRCRRVRRGAPVRRRARSRSWRPACSPACPPRSTTRPRAATWSTPTRRSGRARRSGCTGRRRWAA